MQRSMLRRCCRPDCPAKSCFLQAPCLARQPPAELHERDLLPDDLGCECGRAPASRRVCSCTWRPWLTPGCLLSMQVLVRNGYAGPINSPAWNAQPVFYQSFEVAPHLVQTAAPVALFQLHGRHLLGSPLPLACHVLVPVACMSRPQLGTLPGHRHLQQVPAVSLRAS